jgi:hypothetical protein
MARCAREFRRQSTDRWRLVRVDVGRTVACFRSRVPPRLVSLARPLGDGASSIQHSDSIMSVPHKTLLLCVIVAVLLLKELIAVGSFVGSVARLAPRLPCSRVPLSSLAGVTGSQRGGFARSRLVSPSGASLACEGAGLVHLRRGALGPF